MNAPSTGIAPKRILYIDDDAELARHFKGWLEHSGHRVSTESSPRVALDALSRHRNDFDLVVTDYLMPDLSGIEVARAIHDHHPGLRCAVVTNHVSDDVVTCATAAGVGPVFQKPFAPREYDELIRRCSS